MRSNRRLHSANQWPLPVGVHNTHVSRQSRYRAHPESQLTRSIHSPERLGNLIKLDADGRIWSWQITRRAKESCRKIAKLQLPERPFRKGLASNPQAAPAIRLARARSRSGVFVGLSDCSARAAMRFNHWFKRHGDVTLPLALPPRHWWQHWSLWPADRRHHDQR